MGSRQPLLLIGIRVSLSTQHTGEEQQNKSGGRGGGGRGIRKGERPGQRKASLGHLPGSFPSPALQNCCLAAKGLWQHGSSLMAASAPCHLASLPRDAADSVLAEKARVEVQRRKRAHIVREGTRDTGPSLDAHLEGNRRGRESSPKKKHTVSLRLESCLAKQ